MTMIQLRQREWFKPDPKQPRKSFNDDDINRLGDDMVARGVLVPLLAREDGQFGLIIDGGRRWLAAERKGIAELPVIITDKSQTELEIRGIQIATAIHRQDLTGFECFGACKELLKLNPDWKLADLAKFLHQGAPTVTKWLSPGKCTPAWRDALEQGRVGISDCYAASGLPPEEQDRLLVKKLAGASRDEIAQAGRQHRNAGKPSVKLTRVKCLLPSSGVSIVASGAELSLDEFIESLGEAQKEARKARDNGGDIKSFQSLMAAKSKKRNE